MIHVSDPSGTARAGHTTRQPASSGTAFPPAGLPRFSNVTWDTCNNSGWQATLQPNGQPDGFTAYANSDAGPTPYNIEIYEFTNDARGNLTSNTRLAMCASGTSCTVTAPHNGHDLVAFIASDGTSYSSSTPRRR